MRVIAGKLRRRQLKEVMSETTRSTKDRVKESLFNALTPVEHYENVLDAFAGSGALGIEALSRGAKQCVFIEKNLEAFNVLKDNISVLDLELFSELYLDDIHRVFNHLNTQFDLILLDPPYNTDLVEQSLSLIKNNNLLSQDGVIVILSAKAKKVAISQGFQIKKQKTIGITDVTFIEWSD